MHHSDFLVHFPSWPRSVVGIVLHLLKCQKPDLSALFDSKEDETIRNRAIPLRPRVTQRTCRIRRVFGLTPAGRFKRLKAYA